MPIPSKYPTFVSIPSVGATRTPGTYPSYQAEIREAQAELKEANEKLVKMEQRKENAKRKAKQTVSLYYETHAKLEEALAAQKRAEENNEIQKFQVAGLEQAVQRTEEKRHKERENRKKEHALNSAALLSVQQEFQKAKQELSAKIDFLNSELEVSKEEKSKLVDELEASRDEERKSKKALVNVASTLDEASSEAREAKKALFSSQVENENYKMQIEDLKSRNDKYESMLSDANQEINNLTSTIKHGHYLIDSAKRSEEERACMEYEINRLTDLLKKTRETEAKKIVLDDKLQFTEDCSEDYDIVFPESTTSFVRVCVNEGSNGNMLENKDTGKGDEIEDYNSEVESEMWESLKIDDKEFDAANFDHDRGGRKKNKALLGKIGSLLKKGTS